MTDEHGVPLPDCLIYVAVSPLAQQAAPDVVVARPSAATQPAVEEAAFYLAQPGMYRVAVIVADSTGAVGRSDFTIEVMRVPVAVQGLIYLLILVWSTTSIHPHVNLCIAAAPVIAAAALPRSREALAAKKAQGTVQESIYEQDREWIVELLQYGVSVRQISQHHLRYGIPPA